MIKGQIYLHILCDFSQINLTCLGIHLKVYYFKVMKPLLLGKVNKQDNKQDHESEKQIIQLVLV